MAGSNETTKGGGFKVTTLLLKDSVLLGLSGSGAPTNGTSGTGAGKAGPGSVYTRLSNGAKYVNTNTKASPTWTVAGTVSSDSVGPTELGVTAGTLTASKALVANSAKSIDAIQVTGQASVGGTGVPGAASVMSSLTKAVTAFSDTVAKAVFTVTVPNAAHTAAIEIDALGVMGAGGAVGAGETSRLSKYQLVVTRTAALDAVATLSSAIGGVQSKVAGADNITSVVVTASAMTGASSATQTFTILVAITKAAGAADNHTCVATARLLNQNATGVTIA